MLNTILALSLVALATLIYVQMKSSENDEFHEVENGNRTYFISVRKGKLIEFEVWTRNGTRIEEQEPTEADEAFVDAFLRLDVK